MSPWRTDADLRTAGGERGAAVIPILAMLIVVFAIGSAGIVTGLGHMDRILVNQRSAVALAIADTGVARAMHELELKNDLDATAGIGNVAGQANGGQYAVTATHLGRNYYRLEAHGRHRGVQRDLEVIVSSPVSVYTERGIVARDDLTITGTFTMDSYDSSEGTYASQAVNVDSWGSFANGNAVVASNRDIDAGPNAKIRGDAYPGPNGVFTFHKNTVLTGSSEPLSEPMTLPDPPLERFVEAYNNNQNGNWSATGPVGYNSTTKALSLAAQTVLTLNPGTYFFSSISVTGGAQIVVTGKTKIYVVGNMTFAGGAIVNQTNRPGNLEIIAHPYRVPETYAPPSTPTASFGGGAQSQLAFYGPAYNVTCNGSGMFLGAIVGNVVGVANIDFHFDESLAYDEELFSAEKRVRRILRVAWRELGRPAF
ncbi:MAG: hypothetical protein JXQ29_01715 [Planctomycetes bacterium]|nr:hypothetical protein [Planctomycetota bacterium]